jgi:hypothetical protein
MKRGTTFTAPAILAGVWVYLAMLDALETHSPQELQALKRHLHMLGPDTG